MDGIGCLPIHHAPQGKSLEPTTPFLSVQLPIKQPSANTVLFPRASKVTEKGWCVGVGDTVAIIRDDDPAKPTELILLQIDCDIGRVGIQPIPYELSDSSNRLRLVWRSKKSG